MNMISISVDVISHFWLGSISHALRSAHVKNTANVKTIYAHCKFMYEEERRISQYRFRLVIFEIWNTHCNLGRSSHRFRWVLGIRDDWNLAAFDWLDWLRLRRRRKRRRYGSGCRRMVQTDADYHSFVSYGGCYHHRRMFARCMCSIRESFFWGEIRSFLDFETFWFCFCSETFVLIDLIT